MRNPISSAFPSSRLAVLLLASFIFLLYWTAAAQDVQTYVSSKAGDRITAKPQLRFERRTESSALKFEVNDGVSYQRIDGFGASLLEAGLININSLPPAEQEAVLRVLFDPKEGAGFSAMKTVIASTDFMSAGPFYSYAPISGIRR